MYNEQFLLKVSLTSQVLTCHHHPMFQHYQQHFGIRSSWCIQCNLKYCNVLKALSEAFWNTQYWMYEDYFIVFFQFSWTQPLTNKYRHKAFKLQQKPVFLKHKVTTINLSTVWPFMNVRTLLYQLFFLQLGIVGKPLLTMVIKYITTRMKIIHVGKAVFNTLLSQNMLT